MLQIIGRLDPATVDAIRIHLDTLSHHLTGDVSNYATGRLRLWLEHEAPLSQSRPWQPGVRDERLWRWVTKTFPNADLGLCAYGSVGISPHRDASYADYIAYCVNLGDVEGWYYDCQYPEYRWSATPNPSDPVIYQIAPGDILRFNCKNPHGVIRPAADRWSINLWTVSTKGRPGFDAYLAQQKALYGGIEEFLSER